MTLTYLFDNIRIEANELRQSADYFFLCEPVEDRNEETHVRHPRVVELSHSIDEFVAWGTLLSEDVDYSGDESFRTFGTVLHQSQQFRRLHAHSSDWLIQQPQDCSLHVSNSLHIHLGQPEFDNNN